MLIKVCGITLKNQYKAIAEMPVDMIGFNFYPKSKRYLKNPIINAEIHSPVKNVGVFVNPSLNEVLNTAKIHNLDFIQLHGDESPEFCKEISDHYPIIKAFGVDTNFAMQTLEVYAEICQYFLFDTKTKQYGGSGKKFNWAKLSEYQGSTPFFLSGGIGLEDAPEILNIKHPELIGIDINSGFETEPGVKNIELIKKMKQIVQ
jgi:phosphoribosylanthranilate isomerase